MPRIQKPTKRKPEHTTTQANTDAQTVQLMVTKDRRQRSIRFLIGLCVSIAMLQWAFTWKVPTGPAPPPQPSDDDITFHVLEETPRTAHQRAKAKTIPSSARPVVAPVVNTLQSNDLLAVDEQPDLLDPTDLGPIPNPFGEEGDVEDPDDLGLGNQVFKRADVNPQFPEDLNNWLRKRLRYPSAALDVGVSGSVTVVFTIDRNGKLVDAKVTKGIGWGMDEEVLRVLRLSPDWTPGRIGDTPVAVMFSKQFRFELGD